VNERVIGRYLLCDEFASGGMASVHFGLLLGDAGFTKTVAIKRLHPSFAKDPEFASALIDEGQMQSRVQHPNVCAVLDVVRSGGELLLVMEYLHAAPLAQLQRAARATGERPSLGVIRAVMAGALRGLHAAHEARTLSGQPLDIVHRDVSPQNILVGADGVPRVVDFGIARAAFRSQVTREGLLKGKPGYMAPEQLDSGPIGRAVDIYAAGVVLWELLTGERLFPGGDLATTALRILSGQIDPPSAVVPGLPEALDAITAKALARDPAARFATAAEFADALEGIGPVAGPGEVAAWVRRAAGEALSAREAQLAGVERAAALVDRRSGERFSQEPTTQVTMAPELTPAASARPRSVRAPYVAAAAVLVGAAVGVAALALRGPGPAPLAESAPAAPDAVEVLPAATAVTAEAVPTAIPEVTTPPATAVSPADQASSAAASQASSPKSAPALPKGRAPSATAATQAASKPAAQRGPAASQRAPAASSASCTSIGPDGIKRWSPKCK
jgi:serine/threonine-protein kinase